MKNRIDQIKNFSDRCTGCSVCVDICPVGCIKPNVREDGFRYVKVLDAKCIHCGKCLSVCPIETLKKETQEQHLYAAYARDEKARNDGSSGGIFELLARHFLSEGYSVCGAAFDGMELRHRIVHSAEELPPLLKSKYIQSDTGGIYNEILTFLKNGGKLFFCGTPCQVAALKNAVSPELSNQLFTADIICHGVPSQETFRMYIQNLEEKSGGQIKSFSFRVKNNSQRHAHGFSYYFTKNGRGRTINGIYLQSSYYRAFKKYLFFRESCYSCRYATLERVSDITLGDFWGIERYQFPSDTDAGVSLILANTEMGEKAFTSIAKQTVWKEFPVAYGIESNYCLTNATPKPSVRDAVIESLHMNGYAATAKKYFAASITERIYALLPPGIRRLRKKLRKR